MLEGYVGAEAIDLTPELREHFGAPHDAGVMISKVADGSPAAIAGLFLGDVVFEVDGEPIRSGQALRAAFSGGGVDNRIEVRLIRDGAEITVEPLVTTRPERETRSDED
jgi:serine protease Do